MQKAHFNTSHCYFISQRQGIKQGQHRETGLVTSIRGAKRKTEPSLSLSLSGKEPRAGQGREGRLEKGKEFDSGLILAGWQRKQRGACVLSPTPPHR